MKKVIFSILLFLPSLTTYAQAVNLSWVKQFGGTADDTGVSIAVDAAGNLYTTGGFRNTVDFDPGSGTFNLISLGAQDIFISKIDAAGNFLWAKQIGGASSEYAEGITVDAAGNVYVTGDFGGTKDFDPGPGTYNMSSMAGLDIFVLKLDTNGNFIWAKRMGGTGNDYGTNVLVDGAGNVHVSGSFSNAVDFDPGAGNVTLFALAFDAYVVKLTSLGNFIWAKGMGGSSNDAAVSMALDASGNVYTTGYFGGFADFGTSLTAVGGDDIFISKINSAGTFVWAKQIGGTLNDLGASIALDASGNVYTTGWFRNTADFDPGAGSFPLTAAGGATNEGFVSKLDTNGNFLWAKSFGGTGNEVGKGIAIDASGNSYITGSFDAVTDFDPGVDVFSLTPIGASDAFIVKLSVAGNLLWAQQMGGAASINSVADISLDGSGNLYTTGSFTNAIDADPGNCVQTLTSFGTYDVLVQKFIPASVPSCLPAITSFSPIVGPVGTSVNIIGSNFSAQAASNKVFFGAEKAIVTAATPTQLTVTVPVGATYQPITVTVSGLTAFSSKPFLVTFPEGGTINACSFAAPVGFSAGNFGYGLAMGDLDGDGKTDVAVTNSGTNSVRVFRNISTTGTINGSSFEPSVDFAVGLNPIGVSIADIDGDSKLDMVVTSYDSDIMSLFRNTSTVGSITATSFATRIDFPTGSKPFHVSCADLDGDGRTDIALGNHAAGTISIWRNMGSPGSIHSGTLGARIDIAGPSVGFAIADVDVDGKPDLIGGYNLSSAVGVSRNISTSGALSTGSFAPFVNFTTGAWPDYLAVGDVDSDNRPDIVTSSWPSNTISVLKNTSTSGSITAGSFAANVDFTGNGEPRGIDINDYDGDGLADIGLANQTGSVSIYKNANTPGTITSASFLPRVNFAGIGNARELISGDIDGDGKPDLAVASWGGSPLLVLRNTVSSLPPPTISGFTPTTGTAGSSIAISGTNFSSTLLNNTVKFNGVIATLTSSSPTSITAIVPSGTSTGNITVTIGCNTATSGAPFTIVPSITSVSPDNGPVGTTVVLSGTGFSPIPVNNVVYFGATQAIVSAASSSQLTVTVPVGATFKPISLTTGGSVAYSKNPFLVTFAGGGSIDACSFATKIDFTTGASPGGVVISDLDGDGKADVALANTSSNTISTYRNTGTAGAPSFASSVDFATSPGPESIAVGDIDGDGKPDLVFNNGSVSVLRNISTPGTIAFASRVDFASGPNTRRVAIGDLDGDGKLDMVVPNNFTKVSVFRNLSSPGVINFAARVDFTIHAAGNLPWDAAIGDLDGDGKSDIAVSITSGGNRISLLRNTSSIGVINASSFAPFVEFLTGSAPFDIELGDLDGDSKIDIVTANLLSGTVSVFRNASTPGILNAGSFSAKVDFTSGNFPNNVAIDDFDGDGKPDLAVALNQNTSLSIFKNTATLGSIDVNSFSAKVDFPSGPALTATYDIAAGDLDGDGKSDLVLTNNKLSVFRNTVGTIPPPSISSFSPGSGDIGSTVTIFGNNFSTTPASNLVKFNGVLATVTASTATSITTTVPVNATPGLITVTVGCNTATSATNFEVTGLCLPAIERNALIALYNSTNGASWTDNSNWFSADESTWAGVIVTSCHVTGLIFLGNNLSGPLPPEIGNLTHLDRMELTNNQVSGPIPPQIGNLSELVILGLNANQFSGSIPAQIGNLSNLTTLYLGVNQLSGSIPPEIGNLDNLITLDLTRNQLSGNIPPELWGMTNLEFISVRENQLGGSLPPEVGNLSKLRYLYLGANQFFGDIPAEIGNLTQLTRLQLSNNQFSGQIPPEIGNLLLIRELYLSYNQLSGAIPIEIGNLPVCDVLTLNDNLFTDLPNLTTTPLFILNQNFADITVHNNYLTFEDLEPNKPFPLITLGPQAKIPPGGLIYFVTGGTLTIPFTTPGTANQYQWYNNNIPIPGATSATLVRAGMTAADVGNYTVRITNTIATFVTLESFPFVVYTDPCPPGPRTAGDLDVGFDPMVTTPSTFTGIATQSTGKVLTVSSFTEINSIPQSGLMRFNNDGSFDNTFTSNAYGPRLLVLPDDRIVASYLDGTYAYVYRTDADGDPDVAFNANSPAYYSGSIYALGLQPDGKIIAAASSYMASRELVRLNTDGTPDGSFSAPTGLDVNVIKVQPDGYILLGGEFPGGIMRLDPTGAVDGGFSGVAGDFVTDIEVQPDGNIVVTGQFSFFNDQPFRGVVRLIADGSIDFSFNSLGITDFIELGYYPKKIALQNDGKIILAGIFQSVGGATRKNLVRLNADGSVDCTLDPGTSTDDQIDNMILQSDGKILITGAFTSYEGTTRYGLARVNNVLAGSCLPAIERTALVALYNATNGAGWTNKTNWLNADESTWFGVTISGCHVTNIVLTNNNLTGPIPVEIGNLPYLQELNVSFNQINGTLPSSITNLSNLEILYIDNNNGITGPLPANIGNMTSLRLINTQGNAFTGPIPPSMSNCVALEAIQLEGNQHTGSVPAYFSTFPNLFSINLAFNQFTGSIPIQWGSIINLNYLSLAGNQLTGTIPIELGSLSNLGLMDLSRNQLTGSIPVEFGNLSSLGSLLLYTNQLSGSIPTQLGNILTLEELNLAENQLTGSIPNSFGNLINLTSLYLYDNQLSGSIPAALGNLVNLETLDIFTNQLTGSLPIELAQCVQLKHLEVAENLLTGNLPIEYQALINLQIFQINNNSFTGSVPIEYLAWTQIKDLFMSSNQLDALPHFTAAITHLTVENNQLEFGDLESNMGTTGYVYSPQADLPGGTISVNAGSPLNIPFVTTGTANQYQWYRNGVLIPGATSSNFSIPSAVVGDAGNYTIAITSTIVTGLTITSLPFVVTVVPVITITLQPSDFIACDGDIATFNTAATGTTNITYQWQFSLSGLPATFVDIVNGANYSGATTSSLSVNTTSAFGVGRYRCRINGDFAVEVITFDEGLFVNPLPSAPGTTGNSGCAFTSIILSASGSVNGQYRWYTTPTGGIAIAGEVNDTYASPLISSTTTYYVAINNGTCESTRTPVTASVIPLPSSPGVIPGFACAPSGTVTVGASGGVNGEYRWYTVSTGGSAIPGETNSIYITPVISASVTYYVSINNGICESLRTSVLAEIKSCTPVITSTSLQTVVGGQTSLDITPLVTTISSPVDVNSIKVVVQPISGAVASISGGVLQVDYAGVAFAGTDRLTVEACDMATHCGQQEITIEVAGDITIYNALSPNGDGKNDIFYIQYIDLLPDTKENKVTVFTRWGDNVFEIQNYDNVSRVFRGSNQNGDELPSGTYYYKIEFSKGSPTRTGFISLRR